ncbi:MAG TPA: DUF5996 family protein [Polyangia bacterium]|nr:DUF5996 family protein [Polyangia bacterium]
MPTADPPAAAPEPWPSLDGAGARDTTASLWLWSQLVGKTRLALCPMENHWWQVPLYLSARGLTTLEMPAGARALDVELDLLSHELRVRSSDGAVETLPLCEGALASFYSDYRARLSRMGVSCHLYPYMVEGPERVSLASDPRVCRYDPEWATRFFHALLRADRLFKQFRGRFVGKASPVHFFWGGFDLAVTRFSGRRAPPHPGGIPNVGDWVMREAYSHELSSAGFWPGDPRLPEPAFYSYAYPEPARFRDARVRPAAARYDPTLGEFVLPYRAVREAPDGDGDVLAFLEDTYVAAADLGRWDRAALERSRA